MAVGNPFKGLFKPKTPKAPKAPKEKKKSARVAAREAAASSVSAPPNVSEFFQQPVRKAPTAETNRLPRFQTTAGDQLGATRSDRFAQVRLKVRNAFTPSQPVSDRRFFAGRQGVLAQMIQALEDQRQHLVIYGERGIGKTSLLHVLTEAAREARYIVVYWSCGANSNFDETFRAVASDVPLLFHSGFSPTTSEAELGGSMADLLPPGTVSPRVFGDLCAKITGTRVLVILDEFDRCLSVEFRREIAELIKILSDRSVRVELIIAGVAADLAELVEHIPSIRRNIQTFRIPLMGEEEVRELVGAGTQTSGLVFAPAAEAYVVKSVYGSPYLASLICHHASLAAIDARRADVQVEDVVTGIKQAVAELRDRIPRRIQVQVDRLLDNEAGRALAALAGVALGAGGDFDDRDIEKAAASTSEAALYKRLIQEIASDGGVIRSYELDGRKRYAFAEEGLPPYLWLLNAAEYQQPQGQAQSGKRALTA